jgi:hypothetical protein
LLALVLAGTAALALADHWLFAARARRTSPTQGAEWIWEPRNSRDFRPTAFYAVRDFEVAASPRRAPLLLLADEEYVLYLNAKRIGAGRYRQGAPLDRYDAAPWLVPGANRLVVELRSGRGAGGLLLSLAGERGEPLVQSGPGFQILKRHRLGLMRGFLPLEGGVAAQVWGLPPLGRWKWPVVGPQAPALASRLRRPPVAAPRAFPAGRSAVLFDWGREVTGQLEIELPRRRPSDEPAALESALLWTGMAPPDLSRESPTEPVLPVPESRVWLDPVPRRLRYALVAGIAPGQGGEGVAARIYPVDPAGVPAAVPPPEGVFGIAAPPLRAPVEDEVRRKLQGLAGVALGKER